MSFWLNAYLLAGLLWAAWNSRSRFFRNSASAVIGHKHEWAFVVGIILGALLWPLGPLVYFLLWIRRHSR